MTDEKFSAFIRETDNGFNVVTIPTKIVPQVKKTEAPSFNEALYAVNKFFLEYRFKQEGICCDR